MEGVDKATESLVPPSAGEIKRNAALWSIAVQIETLNGHLKLISNDLNAMRSGSGQSFSTGSPCYGD
jgi:hypothetical protein